MTATKSIYLQILMTATLIVLVIMLFEFTNLDLVIQSHFYNFTTHSWLVTDQDFWLWLVLYKGVKICIVVFGVGLIIAYIRRARQELLLLILAIALVPILIGLGKKTSNIHCPSAIEYFNGDKPYVRLLGTYPADFVQIKPGKCYPAGHASGGFALMALFFFFKRKSYRYFGLALGIALGWIMGFYQITKGAHFFSDTVVTMLVAWLVILLLRLLTHTPASPVCSN